LQFNRSLLFSVHHQTHVYSPVQGEIDESLDPPAALQLVSEDEIKRAKKAEKEQEKIKASMATRFDFLDFD